MAAPLDHRSHGPAPVTCRWEDAADGSDRLVVEGELTRAYRHEVADALQHRPTDSVSRVEIDLAAAVLLDVRMVYLLDAYRAAAADRGEDVRVVNASGTTLRTIQMLGLTALLTGETGARNDERSPHEPSFATAALFNTSRTLVAASRDIQARSRQLCAQADDSRRRARTSRLTRETG